MTINNPKLKEVAENFINSYDSIKYNMEGTIHGFLKLEKDADTLDLLVAEARKREGWREPSINLPKVDTLKLARLFLEAEENPSQVRKAFLDMLQGYEKKQELEDIATGKKLAIEAANEFIDIFPKYRSDLKYNLQNFLEWYDVANKKFKDKRTSEIGNYKYLVDRLKKEHGNSWLTTFYSLLPEDLRNRVANINTDCKCNSQFCEEDKINFIEKAADEGVVGLIEAMQLDSYDFLVAMYGPSKFPEKDRKIISSLMEDKRGIRFYLGRCRKKLRSTDTKYDWANVLINRVAQKLKDKASYNKNSTVKAILQNQIVQKYYDIFVSDRSSVAARIENDLANATNEIEQELLKYALGHYKLMADCSSLASVAKEVKVAKQYT